MATVSEVKNMMLDKLAEMDLDKLTLMDANVFVDVLKKLSDINEKSYSEIMAEAFAHGMNSCHSGYEPIKLGNSTSKGAE